MHRLISMSGHAIPLVVETFNFSKDVFDTLNWIANRLRTALIIIPVCMCIINPIHRREYGKL